MLRKTYRHYIMNGDSTNEADVAKLMDGEKADMVFTDPPYGMNLDTDYSKMGGKGNKYSKVIGDDKDYNPEHILKLNLPTVLFGADYYWSRLDGNGQISVWDKRTHKDDEENKLGNVWGSHFEIIWSNIKAQKIIFRHLWCAGTRAGKSEERTIDGSKPVFLHPTQKPIDLCISVINHYGKPNSVLDLFLGSGSTLIACEKTGRRCYGMEVDAKYINVILKRFEDYSGDTAERIS